MKLLIVGAGISGLAGAGQALRSGFDVQIIESTDRIGGLMRSEVCEGQAYDIGAYSFFQRNLMFSVFPELNDVMYTSNRSIELKNIVNTGYTDTFPFTLHGLLHNFSLIDLLKITASYIMTFKSREVTTLRGWLVSRMGFSFYTKSGLNRYIERYYSLPDDEISMKFAKDRMGYITDFRAENILKHWFHRLTERPGDNSSQTDVQHPLLRPQSGFDEMFTVIEKSLSEYGCVISKNEKIVSLKKQKNSYLVTTNKRSDEAFDLVLLAAPPQSIMDSFSVSNPCNSVESFSLLSLFLKGNLMINGDIFYNSSPYGKWKRLTVFNRLYDETSEFDRFTVEFVVDGNAPQTTIQEAFRDFVDSSEKLFILDSSIKLCGGVYTENAYPKLTIAQEKDIQHQQEFLANFGIASIGRQGKYKYFTSNECVVSAVEKIQQAGGAKE